MENSKLQGKRALIILLLIALLPAFILLPSTAAEAVGTWQGNNQSSFVQNGGRLLDTEDSSIYDGDGKEFDKGEEEEEDSFIGGFLKALKDIVVAPVEALAMGLINPIASFLDYVLSVLGIDLNSVVFGRVGGGGLVVDGNRISLTTFEFAKGNPYGLVSMAVYVLLFGCVSVYLIWVLLVRFAIASWSFSGAKGIMSLKEGVKMTAFSYILLGAFPHIMDMAIYIRDLTLYYIGVKGISTLIPGMENIDLMGYFREMSEDGIMFSLMYLGSCILAAYFAFCYVGIAMSMVVACIAFCINMITMHWDKNVMQNWIKLVLANLLVPLVDATLLLVPAFIGYLGTLVDGGLPFAVLQMMVCTMVIPARSLLRMYMGVAPRMGMELAGIGSIMMAGRALGSAIRSGRTIRNNFKDAKQNDLMADLQDEYAAMELNSGEGSVGQPVSNPNSASTFQPSTGMGEIKNTPISDAEQAILRRHANVDNFDTPEFANLSRQDKSNLYRQRAKQQRRMAYAGIAGGVAGGLLGGGAATFLSPSAKAGFTAAGFTVGSGAAAAAINPLLKLADRGERSSSFANLANSDMVAASMDGMYELSEQASQVTSNQIPDFEGMFIKANRDILQQSISNVTSFATSGGAVDTPTLDELNDVNSKLKTKYENIISHGNYSEKEINTIKKHFDSTFRNAGTKIISKNLDADLKKTYNNGQMQSRGTAEQDKIILNNFNKTSTNFFEENKNRFFSDEVMNKYGWSLKI